MDEEKVDERLKDLSPEDIEEMGCPGTKTRTDIYVYKLEIVKSRVLEQKEEIFAQVKENEKQRKILIELFNELAQEYTDLDNEIIMIVGGKRRDVEARKRQDEAEKGVEVG